MIDDLIIIDRKKMSVVTSLVTFNDVDFVNNEKLFLKIWCYGGGETGVNTPNLQFNDDIGNNYESATVSMVSGGGYSAPARLLNQDRQIISPSFLSGGSGVGAEEQLIIDVEITRLVAGYSIESKTFTCGSGSGDIHFFNGKWNSTDDITKIDLNCFMLQEIPETRFGKWGAGSVINLCKVGDA